VADELLDKLTDLNHQITEHDEQASNLRIQRRDILRQLQQQGWSLERIGKAVGRTKQTVSQWLR
jgi:IS30 family transposase